MKINVSQVKQEAGGKKTFAFAISAEELGLDSEQFGSPAEVEVEGEVVNNGQALEVKGTIYGRMQYCCTRCMEQFTTNVSIPFCEFYQETKSAEEGMDDLFYFEGDEIDVSDLVRESILLSEPLKPLCSQECKGLCPSCGTNLNIETCSCEQENIDPRLAILKDIFNKK